MSSELSDNLLKRNKLKERMRAENSEKQGFYFISK